MALITDPELLRLGAFASAIGDIAIADRDAARDAASSVVLSYLRKRYTPPLVSWSDDVKRAAAAIAAWDLVTLRGFNPANGRDQVVAERNRQAIEWLRDVAAGRVEPEDVQDSTPALNEANVLIASDSLRNRKGRFL